MKNVSLFTVFLVIFAVAGTTVAEAQFRDQLRKSTDYTGSVMKENPSEGADWSNLFNMTMDHSYTMTFSSFGGQAQNINAYTNTMNFYFSEDLTGRLDVSVLHSPFGNSMMNNYKNNGNTGMGADIIIENAELNYQISDKSSISVQFRQVPSYGYGGFYGSPFQRNSAFQHNY